MPSSNNGVYICDDELRTPLLTATEDVTVAIHYPYTEVHLYKRRWAILSAFSILGFMQGAIWNTWGPISTSAKIVFPQWTDATIALLSNWGNICYVLFLVPVIWIMETKGLRCSTVLTSSLLFVGSGIRCLTMDSTLETWFIHAGHIINGIAGIAIFAGPPQVSAAWFPPEQRTTATGLIYVISSLGVAVGSIFPPVIVDEIASASHQARVLLTQQILRLMYLQFFFSALIFLWILVYFPEKPPFPPSLTASIDRLNFVTGIKRLMNNKDVWLVGISFGVSTAVYSCWITVIHLNLENFGVSQREAGWIGFYCVIGGCFSTFLSARLIDLIGGKMKLLLTTGLIGSAVSFLWFMAICLEIMPFTRVSMYLSLILGGIFNYGLQPVFMELAAEVSYPIGEAIVGGFLTGIFNIIGSIFLSIFFIPDIGYIWMNWCLILSSVIALPFLLLVKERYIRSTVDNNQQQIQNSI